MADTNQEQKPKIVLHWLERSRSQRVVWLLEECKNQPYQIEVYKRGSDQLAPASLKQIHPLGKSPTLTITTQTTPDKPLVLAESAAVFEYITDYFAQHLVPKRYKEGQEGKVGGETEGWIRNRFFMHYAEGSLMSMLFVAYLMDQLKSGPIPFFIKPITRAVATKIEDAFLNQNLKTQFEFLESQLATSPDNGEWLCGKDLTSADILVSFPLVAGKDRISASFPKLKAYIERLEKHEGYVRSVKKVEEITGEKYVNL